jgi:hypothetical protein
MQARPSFFIVVEQLLTMQRQLFVAEAAQEAAQQLQSGSHASGGGMIGTADGGGNLQTSSAYGNAALSAGLPTVVECDEMRRGSSHGSSLLCGKDGGVCGFGNGAACVDGVAPSVTEGGTAAAGPPLAAVAAATATNLAGGRDSPPGTEQRGSSVQMRHTGSALWSGGDGGAGGGSGSGACSGPLPRASSRQPTSGLLYEGEVKARYRSMLLAVGGGVGSGGGGGGCASLIAPLDGPAPQEWAASLEAAQEQKDQEGDKCGRSRDRGTA